MYFSTSSDNRSWNSTLDADDETSFCEIFDAEDCVVNHNHSEDELDNNVDSSRGASKSNVHFHNKSTIHVYRDGGSAYESDEAYRFNFQQDTFPSPVGCKDTNDLDLSTNSSNSSGGSFSTDSERRSYFDEGYSSPQVERDCYSCFAKVEKRLKLQLELSERSLAKSRRVLYAERQRLAGQKIQVRPWDAEQDQNSSVNNNSKQLSKKQSNLSLDEDMLGLFSYLKGRTENSDLKSSVDSTKRYEAQTHTCHSAGCCNTQVHSREVYVRRQCNTQNYDVPAARGDTASKTPQYQYQCMAHPQPNWYGNGEDDESKERYQTKEEYMGDVHISSHRSTQYWEAQVGMLPENVSSAFSKSNRTKQPEAPLDTYSSLSKKPTSNFSDAPYIADLSENTLPSSKRSSEFSIGLKTSDTWCNDYAMKLKRSESLLDGNERGSPDYPYTVDFFSRVAEQDNTTSSQTALACGSHQIVANTGDKMCKVERKKHCSHCHPAKVCRKYGNESLVENSNLYDEYQDELTTHPFLKKHMSADHVGLSSELHHHLQRNGAPVPYANSSIMKADRQLSVHSLPDKTTSLQAVSDIFSPLRSVTESSITLGQSSSYHSSAYSQSGSSGFPAYKHQQRNMADVTVSEPNTHNIKPMNFNKTNNYNQVDTYNLHSKSSPGLAQVGNPDIGKRDGSRTQEIKSKALVEHVTRGINADIQTNDNEVRELLNKSFELQQKFTSYMQDLDKVSNNRNSYLKDKLEATKTDDFQNQSQYETTRTRKAKLDVVPETDEARSRTETPMEVTDLTPNVLENERSSCTCPHSCTKYVPTLAEKDISDKMEQNEKDELNLECTKILIQHIKKASQLIASYSHQTEEALNNDNSETNDECDDVLNLQNKAKKRLQLLEILTTQTMKERENMVLKTRILRHWIAYTREAIKQRRHLDVRLDSYEYIKSRRIIRSFLQKWKTEYRDRSDLYEAADNLHELQLMRKCFDALTKACHEAQFWRDLYCSRLRRDKATRVLRMWLQKTIKEKQKKNEEILLKKELKEQLAEKLCSWQQDKRLMIKYYHLWKQRFGTEKKIKEAAIYHSLKMMSKTWIAWHCYINYSIVLRKSFEVARLQNGYKMQSHAFYHWKYSSCQHHIAHQHYITEHLYGAWNTFKEGVTISQVESITAREGAAHCHKMKTLCRTWRKWLLQTHYKLLNKMVLYGLKKNAFNEWKSKTQLSVELKNNELKLETIKTWRIFVQRAKLSRECAISILESVFMKTYFISWLEYTRWKKEQRNLLSDVVKCQGAILLITTFEYWVEQTWKKQKERQIWSVKCCMKALIRWRFCVARSKYMKQHKLAETYSNTVIARNQNVLIQDVFDQWFIVTKRKEEQKAELLKLTHVIDQQIQRAEDMEDDITNLDKLELIAPLVRKRNRKIMKGFIHGLKKYVVVKKQVDSVKLWRKKTIFRIWRNHCHNAETKDYFLTKRKMNLLDILFNKWRTLYQYEKNCLHYRKQHLVKMFQYYFYVWKRRVDRLCDHSSAEDGHKFLVLKCALYQWKQNVERQKAVDESDVDRYKETADMVSTVKVWTTWQNHMQNRTIINAFKDQKQMEKIARILPRWHAYASNEMNQNLSNFHERLHGSSSSLSISEIKDEKNSISDSPTPSSSEKTLLNTAQIHSDSTFCHCCHSPDRYYIQNRPDAKKLFTGLGLATVSPIQPNSVHSLGDISGPQSSSMNDGNRKLEVFAISVITRWKLWPMSAVFHQWLEYTRKKTVLRSTLNTHLTNKALMSSVKCLYRWKCQSKAYKTAAEHWKACLVKKSLRIWLEYLLKRRKKGVLNQMLEAFKRYSVSQLTKQSLQFWRRQFMLVKKCHQFRVLAAMNLMRDIFSRWLVALAQNELADLHYIHTLIIHGFISWRRFVNISKEELDAKMFVAEEMHKRRICHRALFALLRETQEQTTVVPGAPLLTKRPMVQYKQACLEEELDRTLCSFALKHHDKKVCQRALLIWRERTDARLDSQLAKSEVCEKYLSHWRSIIAKRQQNGQVKGVNSNDKELNCNADQYHGQILCQKALQLMKEKTFLRQQRRESLARKYGTIWKHRTAQAYLCRTFYDRKIMKKTWQWWRKEIIRKKVVDKMECQFRMESLSQAFYIWRSSTNYPTSNTNSNSWHDLVR